MVREVTISRIIVTLRLARFHEVSDESYTVFPCYGGVSVAFLAVYPRKSFPRLLAMGPPAEPYPILNAGTLHTDVATHAHGCLVSAQKELTKSKFIRSPTGSFLSIIVP